MPSGNQPDDDSRPNITRRALLAASAGTAAGFAGCSTDSSTTPTPDGSTPTESSNGGSTDTTEPTATGEPIDPVMNTYGAVQQNPNEMNVNPWAPSEAGMYQIYHIWHEQLIQESFGDDPGNPFIALADFRLEGEGCVQVYEFRDDLYWWDGTQVTAQDYMTQRKLDEYLGVTSQDEVNMEKYELEDDFTMRLDRESPINPDRASPIDSSLYIKHDYWAEWLERFEDATTEEEFNTISQELIDYHLSLEEKVEEGLGNGLWKLTDWTELDLTMEIHEDHHRADWTNLEQWVHTFEPDQAKRNEGAANDRIDFWNGKGTESDDLETILEVPVTGARCVYFAARNKHLARVPVRQAFAYMIDHEDIGQILETSFDKKVGAPFRQCGFSSGPAKAWLGEEWMEENLIDYGQTSQPEKAAERMESAGYTKDGDIWVDADGDAAEGLEFVLRTHPMLEGLATYLSSTMEEFGIVTDVIVKPAAEYAQTRDDTHEFDILDGFWSGSHPMQAFYPPSQTGWPLGGYLRTSEPRIVEPQPTYEGGCELRDIETPELHMERGPNMNHPIRDTYPAEPKALDISGEGETIYPVKWYREMEQTQDRDLVIDRARKIAKYMNYSIVKLQYYDETFDYALDTVNFELSKPDADENYVDQPLWLMRGLIAGKTE